MLSFKIKNNFYILFVFLLVIIIYPKFSEAQSIYTIKSGAVINSGTNAGANQKKIVRTSNGYYHAVYTYSDGANVQVFYAKSIDNGATWVETQLSSDSYAQNRPSIAVDSSNNLHVIWWGKHATSTGFNQIRYIKYTNSSSSWGSIVNLTSGNYEQNQSSLAVDSNDNLHVAWQGTDADSPSTNQIRYIKYSGGAWGSITDLTTNTSYAQQRPFIAVDYSDRIHVVWFGYNAAHTNKNQIRYIKYSGGAWGSIVELTDETDDQNYPSLAFDSVDNVHTVWQHVVLPSAASDKHIYYRKYTVGTDSWGAAVDLSGSGYALGQWNPKIEVDSHDYLHVVWNGSDATSASYWNVLYMKYTTSWSSITNLTPDTLANEHPNFVWFASPIIKNVKVDRPKDGYVFTWTAGTSLKFYASSDLDWDVATPPVLSSGSPSTRLPSDTTSVTLAVTTDEASTCKYGTTGSTAYASMPNTFTTTGSTSHSATVSVTNNTSYNYYIRCFGPHTAFNTTDYTISFSVERPQAGHPPIMIPLMFLPTVIAQPVVTPVISTDAPVTTPISTPLIITKNYQLRDKGEDIKLLQKWLNENGFVITDAGPGSKGQETTLFGSLTKKALIKYQKSKGIPTTGFLGPLTRKSLGM